MKVPCGRVGGVEGFGVVPRAALAAVGHCRPEKSGIKEMIYPVFSTSVSSLLFYGPHAIGHCRPERGHVLCAAVCADVWCVCVCDAPTAGSQLEQCGSPPPQKDCGPPCPPPGAQTQHALPSPSPCLPVPLSLSCLSPSLSTCMQHIQHIQHIGEKLRRLRVKGDADLGASAAAAHRDAAARCY